MNQLTSQQAGGALVFKGTVSEPATVTVGGKPATVTTDNRFEGQANVPEGTGQVQLVATDPSGNVRTSTYEVSQGAASKSYTYDANGNMISDGARTYEWDAENRLVAVKEGVTTVASFTYNRAGVRTSKTVAGATTSYVLEGDGVVEERTGGVTARYFHGADIDNVLGMQDGSGAVAFLTRDHLGSVREQMTATGVLGLRRDYDPWGSLSSGASVGGWGFTGRDWDAEISLAYYRARYYDPRLGRFTSEDSAQDAEGNRYAYVESNPIAGTDPSGHFTLWSKTPEKISQQKWNHVYMTVYQACCKVEKEITHDGLRACIKRSCEVGRIKLSIYGYPYDLGGPTNPYWGAAQQWWGSATRNFPMYVNNWKRLVNAGPGFASGPGNVAIHEWAHGCGWFHNMGFGVPINSGYSPDPE